MRHLAWLTGCLLVVSCTVNSSNLDVDASVPGTGGHVIGAGGSGGSGGSTGSGGAGGDHTPTGGATGTGGQVATGGTIGTGGQAATGGRGGQLGSGGHLGGGGQIGGGGQVGAGGQAATGGQIGAGGQTATGGQAGGGGQPGNGGQTGGGGQPGTGGHPATGGQSGAGGGSGRTCAQIENDYATALTAAKACTVSGSDQCHVLVDNSVACPGCKVYVTDGSELAALKTEWTSSGCAQTHNICPAIACIAPSFSTCQPTGGPKPGPTPAAGTCQPLN